MSQSPAVADADAEQLQPPLPGLVSASSPQQSDPAADTSADMTQGVPAADEPPQPQAQAAAAEAAAANSADPTPAAAATAAAACDERKEHDEASSSAEAAPAAEAAEAVSEPVAAEPAPASASASASAPVVVAEQHDREDASPAAVVRIHMGVVDEDGPVQVRASSDSHDSHHHDEEKLNPPHHQPQPNDSVELQSMRGAAVAAAASASPAPPSAADANEQPDPDADADAGPGPVHLITIDLRGQSPSQKPAYTTATFPTVAPLRPAPHNSTLDTLTTAPSSKRALLKTVPNEVLSLMLTFLDARSLVHFGLTASAHNSLSCKKALWMSLLAQPWSGYDHAGQPIKGVKMETHTKGYYAARRLHALEQRRQKKRDHARALVRVKENHRAWWVMLCTDFCFSPCIGVLATVFLICLVWQLVRHQAVGWLTLWPLLAIGALTAVVSCILCCTKYVDLPRGVLPGNFYDQSHGPVKALMEVIGQGESAWGHASFCFMSLVLGTFLVLLCLKIEGSLQPVCDWSWWVIFAPLYVVFAMWCCAPCFRWPATSRIKIEPCVGVWCLLGLPLLAFVILLNVKLADWSAFGFWAVMIPLWSMDLMAFVVALGLSVGESSCAMLFGWMVADGPLMVFKLLLTLRLDRDMTTWTWAYIFIPLYLVQLMFFCGSFALVWAVADGGGVDWEDEPDEPHLPLPPV